MSPEVGESGAELDVTSDLLKADLTKNETK
jgi:hypothetical protein